MNKFLFWFLFVLGIVVFIGGPIFVQFVRLPTGTVGNGDWLGFWGSYLGVMPAGLIAYAVAWYQIDYEKSVEQKRQLENGLPYVKITYTSLHNANGRRNFGLNYEIKSYDGNPLIFKGSINTIRDGNSGPITLIEGLNGAGDKDITSSTLIELYEVTITMFNGTKVFVTNNNSQKEPVHLYRKNEGGKWQWYGIKPKSNTLNESIERAKKSKFI